MDDSGIISTPGEDPELRLVAQYEYTPTATDIDGMSIGRRVEGRTSDDVRIGASAIVEDTGLVDQTFADVGLLGEGAFGAYFEERSEGFSNLDYSVTAATGDETLWGVFIETTPREGLRYSLSYDDYSNAEGERDRSGAAEVEFDLTDRYALGLGIEHIDRDRGLSAGGTGRRTDVGARLTYSYDDGREVYVFGQVTLDNQGLEDTDSIGVGAFYGFDNGWSVAGEVSGGAMGQGGLVRAGYDDGEGSTSYFGYELNPGRTLSGVTLNGRDDGRFTAGARRQVTERLSYFGENTYDMFGRYNSLTTAYGLTYRATEFVSYTGAFECGSVDDRFDNDFDRTAISLDIRYEDEALTAGGRLEYRVEDGLRSGNALDSETIAFNANGRYLIDDSQRLVFFLNAIDTDTDESSILDGTYVGASVGFAYRPVDNDRQNLLVRYRYLFDDVGQRLDDTDELGPRQRSHVFSADANYLLNENCRIGARVGFRLSEASATDADPFTRNVTQTGLEIGDDLVPFAAPAILDGVDLPVATGFTAGSPNAGYDGDADIVVLQDSPELAPGETRTITLTVRYNIATGNPASPNTVSVVTDRITVPHTASALVAGITAMPDLFVSKTATPETAILSDTITYTMSFENRLTSAEGGLTLIDELPAGLKYTTGTALFNGLAMPAPVVVGRQLQWQNITLVPSEIVTIVLRARITGGESGEVTNRAFILGADGRMLSNVATATVVRRVEALFDCADIVGRVFDDRNFNGVFDANTQEAGLPRVRLVTVDGTLITTDDFGRFSVPCAALPRARVGSNFQLESDTRTLPSRFFVTTENPRLLRVTPGTMTVLNFGASLGQSIEIDLTAEAFDARGRPSSALVTGVDRLVAALRETPSVLHLNYYLDGEPTEAARVRLDAIEALVRQEWDGLGDYELTVSTETRRIQ